MKQAITKFSLALCAVLVTGPAWSQADWGTATPHIDPPVPSRDLRVPDAPMLPYHFVQMPALPAGIETTLVSAPALTPQGHLIMLTRNPAAMLMEFDASGKFLRTFDPNITIGPHGLKIDRHGNIWVTDSFLNVVWKLDAKGEPLKLFGTRGEVKPWDDSKWNGGFNQPVDVAFGKDDDFYVVQGHGGTSSPLQCAFCMTYAKSRTQPPQGSDPRVMKFDQNGNLLASRPLPHADGTYPTIHTVMVTPRGEIWVSDRQLRKIMVFDANLQPLREIQEPNLVSGLFVDARGQIWMSAGMDGMIMKLDNDGKILGWIGQRGRTTDPTSNLIGEAHFLAVTPDEKTIYLADSVNGKIVRLEHD